MIYVGNKKYSLYVGDKRRRYMGGGSSLPYDAEVEYLESVNSKQYIDTGIIVSSPYSISGKFLAIGEQLSRNAYIFFGAGYAYNNRNIECFTGNTASNLAVLHGNYKEFVYPYNTIPFTVYYRNKEFSVTNGEDTYQYTFPNTSFETHYTMGLFAIHRSSWTGSSKPVRCYWFTIEDENGVTLIDLIPVRVGQTGYMYDRVSGQLFGNSGTGDFVLGPDKSPSILPSGYTQILGVKNTSTAYLPAPIINAGVRYELEIEATDGFGNGLFSYNSTGNYEIIVFYSGGSDSYLNGKFTLEGFSLNTKFKIVLDLAMESEYARLYINDELVRQTTLHVNIGKDIGIFKDLNRNTYVKGVLYSFRGYKDDVLINDYIPAIRNSDGKVGVYDIASNEFVLSPNDVDFEAVLQ